MFSLANLQSYKLLQKKLRSPPPRILLSKQSLWQGSYVFRNSKLQGFPGLFYRFLQGFSRVLASPEGKQHSQRIVITIKQQCAPKVAIQY